MLSELSYTPQPHSIKFRTFLSSPNTCTHQQSLLIFHRPPMYKFILLTHWLSLLIGLQRVSTLNPDFSPPWPSEDLCVTKPEDHLCLSLFIFFVLSGASSSEGGLFPGYLTNLWFSSLCGSVFQPHLPWAPLTSLITSGLLWTSSHSGLLPTYAIPPPLPPPRDVHCYYLLTIVKCVSPHHASLLSPKQVSISM